MKPDKNDRYAVFLPLHHLARRTIVTFVVMWVAMCASVALAAAAVEDGYRHHNAVDILLERVPSDPILFLGLTTVLAALIAGGLASGTWPTVRELRRYPPASRDALASALRAGKPPKDPQLQTTYAALEPQYRTAARCYRFAFRFAVVVTPLAGLAYRALFESFSIGWLALVALVLFSLIMALGMFLGALRPDGSVGPPGPSPSPTAPLHSNPTYPTGPTYPGPADSTYLAYPTARAYPTYPNPEPTPTTAPSGQWAADPYGRHEQRWWDGQTWTQHVSDAGVTSMSPTDVTIDANDFLLMVRRRMVADGQAVSEVQLPSGPAIVGYLSQFRLAWLATKLHLFVVVAAVDTGTSPLLAGLTRESVDFAKATKGSLRGLQTGVAVMPILVCRNVPADLAAAASAKPGKEFAAINLPAVVDTTNGLVHTFRGRIVWGAVYASWLRERQRAIVGDVEFG